MMEKLSKTKVISVFSFVIISLIIISYFLFLVVDLANNNREKWIDENVNVQLCGTIINKKAVTRWGRDITISCIKINYSNTDSLTIYRKSDYIYLKIKNNIATMVLYLSYKDADSVSINMENNRLEKYYKNGKLIAEYPLSLDCAYASDEDLEMCDNL